MNNHKWKTSNFKWILILICILQLFVPIWASVTYGEVKIRILINKTTNFEAEVLKSFETTKNFFAQPAVKKGVLLSIIAGFTHQYVAMMQGVLFVIAGLFASESEWQGTFAKAINRETKREIALSQLTLMKSNIKAIQAKYGLLIGNKTTLEDQRDVGFFIHTNIDIMLNFFAEGDSLFKKFPLLGTPLLIQLAQLIAIFDPVAKELIPAAAEKPDISCKMRDILIDYRRHTVNTRLEMLHVVSKNYYSILPDITNAMSVKYNQYGYNKTKRGTLSCEKGCNNKYCLKDDFGDYAYSFPPNSCVTDYALLVRHRVEEMFPVELLDSSCTHPARPTGSGWFTIKLREVIATRTSNGDLCDASYSECDPFVKLFIDNNLELQTKETTDSWRSDLDVTSTSYINKDAIIKIEVWDSNHGKPDLILRTEGKVDSFLSQGHRDVSHKVFYGGKKLDETNYINTISFWQDEYPVSDHFKR